ncbi:MAG: TlpA family protein disulfide reductase [Gemmatimonadaceae bacterium]|nr:TlpA family protein disulfide reductase [Gemmatimonadaceae bacterium]
MRHGVKVLVLSAMLTGCGARDAAPPPAAASAAAGVAIGGVVPAFVVATIGGDSARVGGSQRQPVTLVNVWATWCAPCKAEFPELQALHTAYAPKGLRVLAVSIDTDGDGAVAASAKGMGATFPLGRDPEDAVRGRFAAVGIPESWLVSADGRLLWRHTGAIPSGDMEVRTAIEAALGAGGAAQ